MIHGVASHPKVKPMTGQQFKKLFTKKDIEEHEQLGENINKQAKVQEELEN